MTDFTETRSMLKKLAMAHGADTPVGRACHNMLEATENYVKSVNELQRQALAASIERQKAFLNDALSQVH
jgi:hypothetical protein